MAKKSSSSSKSAGAAAEPKSLVECYELGAKFRDESELAEPGKKHQFKQGEIERLAEKYGVTTVLVSYCRELAVAYTESEFKTLSMTPNITPSQVDLLVGVKDKMQRRTLEEQVATTDMSFQEFKRRVNALKPRAERGKGGRAFKIPEDQNDALDKLADEMKRMLRLCTDIKKAHPTLDVPRPRFHKDAVDEFNKLKVEFAVLESWLTAKKKPSAR